MICKMCGYNVSAADLKKYRGHKMPMCTTCREEFNQEKFIGEFAQRSMTDYEERLMDDEGESDGCANFAFLNQVQDREGINALTEEDKKKVLLESWIVVE